MTEENKTYSFKDLVGSVKLVELSFGNQPDDLREPVRVEFGYHDAEGKLWLVEATGTREPAVKLSDVVDVKVGPMTAVPQPAFNPDLVIGEVSYTDGRVYYGPCSVCGDTTSWACSDCKIDTSVSVYVCGKGACQRAHERTHKEPQQ
jgi:hypothetical protein